MPRRKKISTPGKKPGSSNTTYEEGEEMQHDMAKLRDQVQQVSLAQKGTEAKMEPKMDHLKIELKIDMNDLKTNMDELNKLLQERVTNGERVVKETHDEDKRNVNHDSKKSNVGSKTHHIPKIDMRKFYGKDPATWILQMEQFFDLNNVQNTQKVRMETLYLEPNQFVWCWVPIILVITPLLL